MVKTGVANNDETGFKEVLGVVIGKGTGNPLSTEVVSTGVGGELKDGTLGVLTGGDNLIKSSSYNHITSSLSCCQHAFAKRAHSRVKSFAGVLRQDAINLDSLRQIGTYEDILKVLGLSGGDATGSDHGLFPGLGDINVVDTVLGALVDVAGHLFGDVLGTNVDL